ncbi:MAG: phosphodiesterase [Alphaproteobacteria bacterium]|nr:phosphodiesterase [Alphaproteobacteria bacterium]
MIIAQISDLHIVGDGRPLFGCVPTNAMLSRAIDRINALTPAVDAIVATGDLVESGTPNEYATLRTLLAAARAPVFLLPGNHDDRTALRAAFPDHDYLPAAGPLNYAIDRGPFAVVAIDTTVPREPFGLFDRATETALEAMLEPRQAKVVLVATHHPPFATGIWWMDAIGVRGGARFAATITRHKNVERVACGHIHRSITKRWGGTTASVAPSTAHQLALDLADDAFLGLTLGPAGFDLHAFGDDGLTSHTVTVGKPETFFHVAATQLPAMRAAMEKLRAAMATTSEP